MQLAAVMLLSHLLALETPRRTSTEADLKINAGLVVREGYSVTVAAELDDPRFLETDGNGTVFCSRPSKGDILALTDKDGDGVYEAKASLISGYKQVQGMCWRPDERGKSGWLFFSTPGSINKVRFPESESKVQPIEVLGDGQIPGGYDGHWWRSLLVTQDAIYTSIGDSGNISDQSTTERQKVWRFRLDGTGKTLFASGVRNTEKLRIRPGTPTTGDKIEVWGCDHGSDSFGQPVGEKDTQPITDWNPPCELNKYVIGGFYGHPFIVGLKVPRYEYVNRPDIIELAEKTIVPEWCFGAHWAPNGWCWIDPAINEKTHAFPTDHGGDMLVAFHGSWNRSEKGGYCIARVTFDKDPVLGGHPCGLVKIVSTLDGGDRVVARPVDCLQMPDGSVLFSSDTSDRIYRLKGR